MTGTMTKTAPSVVPKTQMDEVVKLDSTATASYAQFIAAPTPIKKALIAAHGMKQIKACLTDSMMGDILELQNSPLGFRTDRENGYRKEECRGVITLALLRGLKLTGNEFNIIAGTST